VESEKHLHYAEKNSVAAAQINCHPGKVDHSLAHAEKFIGDVVEEGARLVFLPELMPGGYVAAPFVISFMRAVFSVYSPQDQDFQSVA